MSSSFNDSSSEASSNYCLYSASTAFPKACSKASCSWGLSDSIIVMINSISDSRSFLVNLLPFAIEVHKDLSSVFPLIACPFSVSLGHQPIDHPRHAAERQAAFLRQLAHRAPALSAQNATSENLAAAKFAVTIKHGLKIEVFDQLVDVLIQQIQLIAHFCLAIRISNISNYEITPESCQR